MPALLGTQQVACTADFKIPHGYFEAASQFCVLLDGRRVDNLLIGVSSHKFESEYKAVANYDIL